MQLLRWRDEDLPVDFYAEAWGRPLLDVISDSVQVNNPARILVESRTERGKKKPTAKSKLKAQKTREAKKNLARTLLKPKLAEGDMRKNGLQQHAMKALDLMLAETGAAKS